MDDNETPNLSCCVLACKITFFLDSAYGAIYHTNGPHFQLSAGFDTMT